MKLYNLKSTPTGFAIASFDEDFNLLAAYSLTPATRGSGYTCDCPANNRTVITSLCRHRKMLPLLMGAVNTNRFYNHDTGGWVELGEVASEASSSILDTIDPSWGIDNSGPSECRDESTSSPGEIEGPGHPLASLIKNSILDDLKFVEVDSAHGARDSEGASEASLDEDVIMDVLRGKVVSKVSGDVVTAQETYGKPDTTLLKAMRELSVIVYKDLETKRRDKSTSSPAPAPASPSTLRRR